MSLTRNFIQEYDFPYHEYLLKNYNFFNRVFEENIQEELKRGGANITFQNNPIHDFLYEKLNKIIDDNFYVTPTFNYNDIGIYKQTDKIIVSVPHCHITKQSISSVFYLNPPKEGDGGEIQFWGINTNDSIIIQPKPNKLYVFPGWMFHKPLPQTTPTPRFSFNWGCHSITRPIHKITGDLW